MPFEARHALCQEGHDSESKESGALVLLIESTGIYQFVDLAAI
jgi:hypothetical protein